MEHIPKPLLRRLALTSLVGAGCFFIELVLFFREGDTSFFFLGILLFIGSVAKAMFLTKAALADNLLGVEETIDESSHTD